MSPSRDHMPRAKAWIVARECLHVAVEIIIHRGWRDVIQAGGDVVGNRIHQRRRKPGRFISPIWTGGNGGKPSLEVKTRMPVRSADSGRIETAMPASTAEATTVDDQLVKRIW